MFWSRSTKAFEIITITQHEDGSLDIAHNFEVTRIAYDEPQNEHWPGMGRWRIVSSEEFPQTVGQIYTGVEGAVNRVVGLILSPPED